MRTTLLKAAALAVAGSTVIAGTAQADAAPNLVGGHAATTVMPWMTAVTFTAPTYGKYNEFNCGGTLVFPNLVITAAHCHTNQPSARTATASRVAGPVFHSTSSAGPVPVEAMQFRVRVGSLDRTKGGEVAKVARVEVNPGWAWGSGDPVSDITALVLDRDVEAQPLQIAAAPAAPGDEVTLYGWGRMRPDNQGNLPKRLQQLETTVLDPQQCAGAFQSSGEICTDNPNGTDGDAGGDSGSPAVAMVGGVPKFIGICSRGYGPPGTTPNVYTSPPEFRKWIYDVARRGAAG